MNCGRGATRWKALRRGGQHGNLNLWHRFHRYGRKDHRNFHGDRIHLTMGEKGDGALVRGIVGVLVKPFVQRGTGRQGVEKQNQRQEQSGHNRLAILAERLFHRVQSIGNMALGRAIATPFTGLSRCEPEAA